MDHHYVCNYNNYICKYMHEITLKLTIDIYTPKLVSSSSLIFFYP